MGATAAPAPRRKWAQYVPRSMAAVILAATCSPIASAEPPRGIYIVPQSHIDVAWFWRYDPETIEVCIPFTWGRAADSIEQIPGFRFSATQVPLFEGMRRYHPQLAERIGKLIRDGRFEIVGAPWVEFEGTGPCGESIVRQCVYGKRYYKETYGLDIRNAWQVDAWSHPWTLPQILTKCGIDAYVFKRGLRGDYMFEWESADGSRVLAVRPFERGGRFNDLATVLKYHDEIRRKYGVDVSMWMYGEGDHGGGSTREDIESLIQQMAASPVPARFSRADEFLVGLMSLHKKDWPVLRDELGWELEGCHSNTGRLKAANRRCENLLMQAETFASIASRVAGAAYPKAELKQAWLDVLFNQFHDIISGAVIPAGYEDAMAAYARIETVAGAAREDALNALCKQIRTEGHGVPVVVFNSLSWSRTGPVETTLTFKDKPQDIGFLSDDHDAQPGQILSVERCPAGWRVRCVFVAHGVPGIGYKTYRAVRNLSLTTGRRGGRVRAGEWQLESDRFALAVDPKSGDLARVRDKRRNADVLPDGARGNEVQILKETGSTEGDLKWGDERWSPMSLESWNGWKIVESGPVRTTIRIRNKLPDLAAVERFITLYRDAEVPWVAFRTHFEWNGVDKMVKLAFPTPYRQAKPTYDIPYGTIARESTGQERPAINWVDLGDETGGVSLLNDCRYGHDVRDGVIRLDAIRSKTRPATHTEAGHQNITYALYPHEGDWRKGRVMQRGSEFNNPMIGVQTDAHDGRVLPAGAFVTVDKPNVILSVIKRAEDGEALIARAYEIEGEQSWAAVELDDMSIKKAAMTDMLEQPRKPIDVQTTANRRAIVQVPVGAYEIVTIQLE
jgi:alpha-mannosidase